jgi:uncharacterized protein with PIN domain
MIERLRSEYDGDFPNKLHEVSKFRTENHQQEIRCSVCGELYFVDDEKFKELERLMKYDMDNQFLCDECERKYQDAAFE